MDIKIYNELLRLRQKFKDEGKRMQGRAPLVCSDDALLEIAELCPKKLSDFESVPGIGKSFIENHQPPHCIWGGFMLKLKVVNYT